MTSHGRKDVSDSQNVDDIYIIFFCYCSLECVSAVDKAFHPIDFPSLKTESVKKKKSESARYIAIYMITLLLQRLY